MNRTGWGDDTIAAAERYRSLFLHCQEAMFSLDCEGRCIEANPSASVLTGYSVAELLRMHFTELLAPEEAARMQREFWKGLAGDTASSETVIVRKDGVRRRVAISTAPMVAKGETVGVFGIARDITVDWWRQRAQATRNAVVEILTAAEALTGAATLLLAAIGRELGCPVAVLWTVDAPAGVLRLAEFWRGADDSELAALEAQCRELTHRRGEGLPGLVWAGGEVVVVPDLAARGEFPCAALARSAAVRSVVAVPLQVGVEVLGVLLTARPEAGAPEAGVVESLRMIGSMIGQFLKRHQAERRLRESERWFRALVERSVEYITLLDATGRITYESPNEPRSLGYRVGELVGRNVFELVHPEDRDQALKFFMTGLSRRGESDRIELRARSKDGRYRVLEIVATNLLDDSVVRALVLNARDVTERRAMEEALRESEERFRALFESRAVGVAIAGLDGKVAQSNAAFQELLGYNAAELATIRFSEFTHPDDVRAEEPFIAEMLAGRRGFYQIEKRYRRRDGTDVPVRLTVVALRDAGGHVTGGMAVVEDITERQRAEAALRESEERYRLMLDAAPVLAWRCDAAGACIDCNVRWYEYTGQSVDEARGWGWLQAVHPDDRARTMQKVKDDVGEGMIYQTEYRLRRAMDGTYRWHLARALPVTDARGQTVAWIGCGADIEDQKRTAQELEQLVAERTAALRESEERYRRLVQTAPMAIGVVVAEKLAFINDHGLRLYGAASGTEVLGRSIMEFVHPDDRNRLTELSRRAVAGSAPPLPLEVRLLRRDGSAFEAMLVWSPVVFAGQPGFQFIYDDISDRQRLERQLLAISEREQRRIAQDLHDGLCQHLSGVAFMAEALQRVLRAERVSAQPRRQLARLCALLDEAVNQTRRIARGLAPVNLEAGGLAEALHELAIQVREVFGVRCRLYCPRPVTLRDPAVAMHLYRIVQEAVQNALRHGRPTELTIGLTARAGRLRLSVRDNGRGLPRRPRAATGMGLGVMRYRAEAVGGSLRVENTKPHGVLVSCNLPYAVAPI